MKKQVKVTNEQALIANESKINTTDAHDYKPLTNDRDAIMAEIRKNAEAELAKIDAEVVADLAAKPAKKKLTQKQIERREIKAAEATNRAITNGTISYPAPAIWTPDQAN